MVKIRVLLFASLADDFEGPELAAELPDGATVAALREHLAGAHPGLADRLPRLRVAVNQGFAADDTVLTPDAEVALIPPVSGG